MKYLLDTNVLLRWSDSGTSDHALCIQAVDALVQQRNVLFVCAQVLIESYVVATRPLGANGLGHLTADAQQFLTDVRQYFPCLPEPADMADLWQQVAVSNNVSGRQAHDARIAALMLAHGIKHILTLNVTDFSRYEGITPISPSDILAG